MREQQRLLDAIEDANDRWLEYKRWRSVALGVLLVGVLTFAAGPVVGVVSGLLHVDLGVLVFGMILGGLMVGAGGGVGCMFLIEDMDPDRRKRELRRADREYRDWIAEEVTR